MFGVIKKPIHFVKKHKIWSAIILIAVVFAILIFRPKPPVLPDTQTVTKTNLVQTVSVSGSIDATSKADLTFPIAGKLVWLGAKEGDHVSKFQTIAQLDQRTLEANLQNAEAALDSQQISYDITNDKNGDRTLADTGLSISAYRELKQAMDTLNQSQLAVRIQQIAQEQSALVSPIDGIITHEDVTVPNVNVAITNKFSVVDPTTLTFNMDVDEADISKVVKGDTVNLTLDAYPSDTISLPVSYMDFDSHTTTNGGNAYTVKVNLPVTSKYNFRLGMNGNADIVTAEKDNVLTVPLSSLTDDNSVYVKVAKGYRKQKLSLGLENDIDAEVVSGLHEGDHIVLDPSKVPAKLIVH